MFNHLTNMKESTFNYSVICFFMFLLFSVGCTKDISIDKSLIGKNQRSIINKLGEPSINKEVNLTENVGLSEYQSNLYALHPNLKLGDTVKIKELLWENDDYTEVVWLENKRTDWVVVDHLKWSSNIQF